MYSSTNDRMIRTPMTQTQARMIRIRTRAWIRDMMMNQTTTATTKTLQVRNPTQIRTQASALVASDS